MNKRLESTKYGFQFLWKGFVLMIVLLGSPLLLLAQSQYEFDEGMRPFGAYQAGDVDSTNLSNGALSVTIPLISYPQRGGKLKLEYTLRYHSGWSQAIYSCDLVANTGKCVSASLKVYGRAGNFNLVDGQQVIGYPVQTSQSLYQGVSIAYTSLSFTSADGATHAMAAANSAGSLYRSTDATGFSSASGFTDPIGINYMSGTCPLWSYQPDYYATTSSSSSNNLLVYYCNYSRTDPNSNAISFSQSSGWTDTLGRTVPLPTRSTNPADFTGCSSGANGTYPTAYVQLWNAPGLDGNGHYPIKFCYFTQTFSYTYPPVPGYTSSGPVTFTASELQNVVLPDGAAWTVLYTVNTQSYIAGLIPTRIVLPTGGAISYGWTTYSTGGACSSDPTGMVYETTAVGTRSLDPADGVSSPSIWTYSYGPPLLGVTTVQNPDGSRSVHTFGLDTQPGTPDSCYPYENQVMYYDVNDTLLKTENTTYSYAPSGLTSVSRVSAINVVPATVTTIWPNGQQRQTKYSYDSGSFNLYACYTGYVGGTTTSGCTQNTVETGIYGSLLEQWESDYGSGNPGGWLSDTRTTYKWQTDTASLNANLLGLISSVQVNDSGGTQRAYTTYSYDEANGSPSGIRGNLTSTHRWLNTNSTYLITSNVYDSNGRVTSTTDPKNNPPTMFGYSSTSCPSGTGYAGSGPTSVTDALGHTTYSCYDLTTGLLKSLKDPNNQTTSYAYDSMFRTTNISYPDTGQTTFAYPTPNEVDISEKIDTSGRYKTASLLVDGLGRKIRQIASNGESLPYDQSDTTYDGLGRVGFKSYPYQGNGFSTARVTSGAGDSFAYDALGRTTTVTHSDDSTVLTSYTGRATSVQDEGNGAQRVQRVSQVDGLGRLNSVCEVTSTTLTVGITGSTTPAACSLDIAATGFLTTYSYDTLDDLTSVAQGQLNARSFAYDSLSRLTNATNPESGTTAYAYDSDGNLATKTSPAPNQTGTATVTTTYTYDPLNRLIGKTYSDGTPAVSFAYDNNCSASGVAFANTIGRKCSESTAGTNATGSIFSYDAMGRVSNNSQCTPQNCSGTLFSLAYTYDLLGDVTTSTNGLGTQLNYSYNLGARLGTLTSSLSDANHPGTLFSNGHYNAFGNLVSDSLGNGASDSFAYTPQGRAQALTVPGIINTPQATPGTGSATIGGSEQSQPAASAAPGTGTVTVAGSEQGFSGSYCVPPYGCFPYTVYNYGTVSVTVNGVTMSTTYGASGSAWSGTSATIAASLASVINGTSNSPVSATVSGSTVTLTAKTSGSSTNYPLSTSVTWLSSIFASPSFTATASGATLSGGANATNLTYDAGILQVTVNGFQASASYGQGSASASIASAIASVFNTSGSSPVTATVSGSTLTLTSKLAGASTNYSLSSGSSTSQSGTFSQPSFTASTSGSTLTGGLNQGANPGTVYSYSLSYAPDGNVLAANDGVNGYWTYAYDAFNRLCAANQSSTQPVCGQTALFTYDYDRFGNRWHQNGTHSSQLGFDANNRIAGVTGMGYDAAGDLTSDGSHTYAYDAEGRIAQVDGGSTATYVYDAEGRRVRKTTGGTSVDFLYDLAGHEITQLNPTGSWTRGEVYSGGRHLATYSGGTGGSTYFIHADWLGTERARTTAASTPYETCTSLPFGDWLTCSGGDPSPTHFTGKEHDYETNLENFGARFDSSSLGRFMTVDPSMESEILEVPQTWNRYAYVYNRPTFATDPDGSCPPCIGAVVGGIVEGGFDLGKQLYHNGGSLSGVSWKEVGANAAGGFVAGAIAGATGGASIVADALIGDVVAGGTSNVVGGIVTRTLDPGTPSDEVMSLGNMSEDALSGFVGGAGGHVAAELTHIPNPMKYPTGNDRMLAARMAKYVKRQAAIDRAVINQGVRSGVSSSVTSHVTDYLSDLLRQWFWRAPQCHTERTGMDIYDTGGGLISSTSYTQTVCD